MPAIAKLRCLKVYFYDQRDKRFIRAVEEVGFSIEEGNVLGIVGESGCGKTVTALSLMGLLGSEPGLIGGEFHFKPRAVDFPAIYRALEKGGRNGGDFKSGALLNLFHGLEWHVTFEQDPFTIVKDTEKWLRRHERIMLHVRGKNISMVFQNPRLSLNPFVSVGRQLEGTLRRFERANSGREAREQAIDLLRSVRLRQPELVLNMFPGSLSVGMAQRVVLAIALSSNPKLLIADEPTTGLDMTNVHKVIELLGELRRERNLTLLLISHDFGIVGTVADRIVVMYAGFVVEDGAKNEVMQLEGGQHHPYTGTLLAAMPKESEPAVETPAAAYGGAPDNRAGFTGCPFLERCPRAVGPIRLKCASECPRLVEVEPDHFIRCFLFLGVSASMEPEGGPPDASSPERAGEGGR